MKILFHGNKDSGRIMIAAIVIIYAVLMLVLPLMTYVSSSLSCEIKMNKDLHEKIELHNQEVKIHNEIN